MLLTCPLLTSNHEIKLYNNDTNGQLDAHARIGEQCDRSAAIAMYCPYADNWDCEYVFLGLPEAVDLYYAMIDRGEIDNYACVVIVELDKPVTTALDI